LVLLFALGVVLLVVLLGVMSRPRDRRGPGAEGPPPPVERARPDAVAISAARLVREFQNDPDADRKYKGKYLELTGTVERTGKDRDDTPYVVLSAGDDRGPLKIECFFDDADEAAAARVERLPKGQTVIVRSQYSGRISHLQVHDCVLVE
jgi:hypothetical protein